MIDNGFLFSDVGIDSIGFYSPRFYMDLEDLAKKRNVDPDKYRKGLMLKEMRLPQVNEDIISIGLKAGYNALIRGNIDPKQIDAIFVGTETITYAVKSVSNIFADLLGISQNCMTQDVYNACAAGTLAILNAIALIEKDVINKALIISADISEYEIGSPSECTQGSGAVGLVLSKNPRIATFSKKFGKVSGNVNDFFRPAYDKNAKAFGHYSVDTYLNFQLLAYDDLISNIGDFHADYYTFHAPFSKLPLKAMRRIIRKRWMTHINELPKIRRNNIGSSLLKKLSNFLHDFTALPEYIYLKLNEKGFSSRTIEKLAYQIQSNIIAKALPQLRVPMHFGNMYSASLWSQIIYLLENFSQAYDTIYFGSYGSGATCISGLLKVQEGFQKVVKKGPHIDDFIKHKIRKSVEEYEEIKRGVLRPKLYLGKIEAHKKNSQRGFTLYFCDEGCIIPNIKGINRCPQGHSGFHKKFFPLFATLKSELIPSDDLYKYISEDNIVLIEGEVKKNKPLEYEIRRINNQSEKSDMHGLINWSPIYVSTTNIY
jgi:3-hydroxy-3-methylglutaryl CoA synthase